MTADSVRSVTNTDSTPSLVDNSPKIQSIRSAQNAIEQGNNNPSSLSRCQKFKAKCGELSDMIKEISVDAPKNQFKECLSNGFGSFERWKGKNWGMSNPLNIEMLSKNTYVQEMWSPDYFVACKEDAKETLNTLGRASVHLGATIYRLFDLLLGISTLDKNQVKNAGELLFKNFVLLFEDLGNLFLMAGKLFINVEVLNFVKGVVGVIFSFISFVVHTSAAALSFIPAIVAYIAKKCGCEQEWVQKTLDFFMNNTKCAGKDILAVVACVGHAIPSWLPFVVMHVCPPVGIGLIALKIAGVGAQYVGISDVAAYSNTFALLYFDKKDAVMKFKDQEAIKSAVNKGDPDAINQLEKAKDASDKDFEKAKETIKHWMSMKHELNPFKSKEGAILAGYGVNMVLELISTVVELFVPGAGTALKYGSYAGGAVSAAALRGYGYCRDSNSVEPAVQAVQ